MQAKDNAEAQRTRRIAETEGQARRKITQRALRAQRLAETEGQPRRITQRRREREGSQRESEKEKQIPRRLRLLGMTAFGVFPRAVKPCPDERRALTKDAP